MLKVYGAILDSETRCIHYHSTLDRIAIKFYCCQRYFPCYICHEESGCATPTTWPQNKFHEKGVLCGACHHELTINQYLNSGAQCPFCQAAFNARCSLHYSLYFQQPNPQPLL